MKQKVLRYWGLMGILCLIFVFNFPIFQGFMPAPLDAMIGLYHPFRDLYAVDYPNGIPFKNYLITDPFRQLIVWKDLSIDIIKSGHLPLWNPYEMAGKPLLGNFQSGVFYPINIIFFIFPFKTAWSVYIFLAQIIGGLSVYLYLGSLKKKEIVKLLGSVLFIFSGFFIAWYEWGNVTHAYAWFPLGLFLIEKVSALKVFNLKKTLTYSVLLGLVYFLSLTAGHPQTTIYLIVFSTAYIFLKLQNKITLKLHIAVLALMTFLLLSFPQLYQGVQFILFSLRGQDQIYSAVPGWFIPYQNFVQFLAPDFFGNPSTLNYWGVFNYAEFVGYIGVPAMFFIVFSFLSKKNSLFYFFLGLIICCALLGTNNLISQIPYYYSFPMISSMQPTRLLGFLSFGMIILSVIGFEYFLGSRKIKEIVVVIGIFVLLFTILWGVVFFNLLHISAENILVSKRNLILPSMLLIVTGIVGFIIKIDLKLRTRSIKNIALVLLFVIIFFDLLRFANKFTPFSLREYYYPTTNTLEFLRKNTGGYRVLSVDDRILAPNILTNYKIQSISGYDPLYLKNFAELVVASERGRPDRKLPYGFNRIISPKNIDSKFIDLLGVKYIISLGEITSEKYKLVHSEGSTKVYENKQVIERAFFVERLQLVQNQDEALSKMFQVDLENTAIVSEKVSGLSEESLQKGTVHNFELLSYVTRMKVSNMGNGFLVVSDSFYPFVKAYIDGKETKIYETDYAIRGVAVPKGTHVVEFKPVLF